MTQNQSLAPKWFHLKIKDLKGHRELRWFAAVLCGTHILTALHWWWTTVASQPACWPFFPDCDVWSMWISAHWHSLQIVYAALSAVAGFCFLRKKVIAGWWLFLLLALAKTTIHLSDFRFMGNYHYMSHVVNFAFLFLPQTFNTLRIFIVSFYMSAGLIKFNTDWLSGAAMIRTPIVSGKLLELACAYVVVLELAVVPWLLSRSRLVRSLVLFQLFIFHLFSWHIVGFFYPSLMLALLSIFLLAPEPVEFPRSKAVWTCIGMLSLAQLYPFFFERNSSLNGHARIMALNMLDAKSICQTRFLIQKKHEVIEYAPRFDQHGIRIRCDAILVIDRLHRTCADQKNQADFIDIAVDHQVRRVSDFSVTEQFSFQNACRRPLRINALGYVTQADIQE